ncbi:hypothetical protein V8G54_001222, partial [Vigna mungo]
SLDQLVTNHTFINCRQQKVVFQDLEGVKIVSAREVQKDIGEGDACYVVLAQEKNKSAKKQVFGILVVEEFAYVFPEEVSGLLPSQEVSKIEETNRRFIRKEVHPTKCITMGSSSVVGKEERWTFKAIC